MTVKVSEKQKKKKKEGKGERMSRRKKNLFGKEDWHFSLIL